MRPVAFALAAALAALAGGCSNAPSETECRALLEHTISLELAAADVAPDAPEAAEQSAQLAELTREEFMKSCLEQMPRERVACAMKAKTKADLIACDDK